MNRECDHCSNPLCQHGELLHRLHEWSKAYPEDIFPKPDYPALNATPEGASHTTTVAADMGRHVIARLLEAECKHVHPLDDDWFCSDCGTYVKEPEAFNG